MHGIDSYSNSSCTAGSFSWPLDFLSRRSHPSSRSSLGQKARSDRAAPAVTPSVVSRQHPSPGRRDLPSAWTSWCPIPASGVQPARWVILANVSSCLRPPLTLEQHGFASTSGKRAVAFLVLYNSNSSVSTAPWDDPSCAVYNSFFSILSFPSACWKRIARKQAFFSRFFFQQYCLLLVWGFFLLVSQYPLI